MTAKSPKTMPNENTLRERLERWSRVHAIGVLAAQALAGTIGNSIPIAGLAFASFFRLLWVCRRDWTPTPDFGWANCVTALRLALVLLAACALSDAPDRVVGGLVLGTFLLDGVDGWLARRLGTSSEFGAHFDMETDALFVVVVTQALWQRGSLGPWILTSGWLRYVYVLFNALVPGAPMPRSAFGRIAFGALIVGLVLAFIGPRPTGALAALAGTLLVGASFFRSFYWTWVTRCASNASA